MHSPRLPFKEPKPVVLAKQLVAEVGKRERMMECGKRGNNDLKKEIRAMRSGLDCKSTYRAFFGSMKRRKRAQ